ncbi:cytosolic beta-glucosidase-like [Saccoglossus kowalevskii]|uniref:beta-glucosidase n=1 Tax=Saccoglossus kowalevskii TaxID=10224 RepID=A0ABM0ME44_SACKO|nr:PREDICTED: lactase-phlorizin hydrolase-like [Saccoglossus kowalevskii]
MMIWLPLHFFTIAILTSGLKLTMADTLNYDKFVYSEFNDPERDQLLYGHFPDNFTWAVATASYQVEGAWNEDGKGLSIWDTFTHQPNHIYKNHNGDVACDSYHKIAEDIDILKDLGVTHYRFSLSWPRILPDGTVDNINNAGIDYYNRLIDALIAANIQPMVTLYHWDLPQSLQDIGGWSNDILAVYFNLYAELCFEKFGDRVKTWITLNEPYIAARMGHEMGVHAPGLRHQGTTIYRVGHTMLKAHAKAWHSYNTIYRPDQKGSIGITLVGFWGEPASDSDEDRAAADRYVQFMLGWFAHPIFIGDYPDVMKEQILKKSRAQGLTSSRLPSFTEEEINLIRGTSDFIGLNYYTTQLVRHAETETLPVGFLEDQDQVAWYNESWPKTGVPWLRPVPWGFRKIMNWIKMNYDNPPIIITENGVAEFSDGKEQLLNDTWRIQYITSHVNEMLKAHHKDGVDVRGYTAWSLTDSFEWTAGYAYRFGLYYMNADDPIRKRIPKASVDSFSEIIRNNGFLLPYEQEIKMGAMGTFGKWIQSFSQVFRKG